MELKPLKEIYALLSDKAKETAPGKILAERIADLEKVSIAATAPDFTLTTPEGKQVSLYSVKGKLKIIDFWLPGADRAAGDPTGEVYRLKDKGLGCCQRVVGSNVRYLGAGYQEGRYAVDTCLFAERMEVRGGETIQHRCRTVDYCTGRKQPHFSQEHQSRKIACFRYRIPELMLVSLSETKS